MPEEFMENYLTRNLEVKNKKPNKLKSVFVFFCGILLIFLLMKMNSQTLINPFIESHALTLKEIKVDKNKTIDLLSLKELVTKFTLLISAAFAISLVILPSNTTANTFFKFLSVASNSVVGTFPKIL